MSHARYRWMLSLLLVVGVAASPAVRSAGLEPTPRAPRPVGPTGIALPAADPLAHELGQQIERHEGEYASGIARLAQARTPSDAFAAQEALRQSQVELQVALLRIHAAHARRAGRERFAWALDRAVDELITPESSRIRQQAEAPHR